MIKQKKITKKKQMNYENKHKKTKKKQNNEIKLGYNEPKTRRNIIG